MASLIFRGSSDLGAVLNEATTREEITRARDVWVAAINAGDADAFVSVLVDDAVWLPWGSSSVSTKTRIREWLSGPFEQFEYHYSLRNIRLRIAGDWAAERADFETRAVARNGAEAPVHRGCYTILWRNTERGWLIERYLDHTGWDSS